MARRYGGRRIYTAPSYKSSSRTPSSSRAASVASRNVAVNVMADEAGSWNDLHARYSVARIDHGQSYSLPGGVYTNGAEEFFSRLRRGEIGHHHHVAGPYLVRYAQESAWREDHRRVANGTQVRSVMGLAMKAPTSVDWCGYWQRAAR